MVCVCQPGHCAVMHGWPHAVIAVIISQAPLIILQAVGLWDKALQARDLQSTAHTSYLGLGRIWVQLWPAVCAVGRVQSPVAIHRPIEKGGAHLYMYTTGQK